MPARPVRVFVSHSSSDKPFADRLLHELGVPSGSIFYDKWSIAAGDLIPERISDAISEIDFFVCILSPESVKSQWVKAEWSAAVMRALSGRQTPVILPLLMKPCDIPALLKPYRFIDFTSEELFDVGVTELRDRLGLDFVGDDDRRLDESLFSMPAARRRELFERLLSERHQTSEQDDARMTGILDLYKQSNFEPQAMKSILPNARVAAHYFARDLVRRPRSGIVSGAPSPFVISVCGFPGLGKTTFARELRLSIIREADVTCTIVELEKWMRNRSDRWDGTRNLVSGFDPDAFHFDELVAAVQSLVAGEAVAQPLRVNGDRADRQVKLAPADVLILDGVLSFADEFRRVTDCNVYFDADLATRYLLAGAKDSYVRGYDAARRHSKFFAHETSYPRSIQAQRTRADCIFIVTPYHNYRYYPLTETKDAPKRARKRPSRREA